MAREVLSRIPPLNPELVPDPNWTMAGTTPTGKQLYIERSKRHRATPMLDPATGERVWKKHPVTAEPLYPRNRAERYTLERMFYLEADGRGNVLKHDWRPPSPAEIAARDRAARITVMGGGRLGEALVDAGITDPEEIVRRLTGSNGAARTAVNEPSDEADDEAEAGSSPQWRGPGKGYELSNGEFVNRTDADPDEDADELKGRALTAELGVQRAASSKVVGTRAASTTLAGGGEL